MMLEDDFTYVIRKALKGLSLAPGEAAIRAGLPEAAVLAFSRGNFSPDIARRLAPVLGLNAAALANHPDYLPKQITQSNMHRIDLPFGQDRVNAWLIQVDDIAILFDTGFTVVSCDAALDRMGISEINGIFITHDHPDHVGGIASFLEKRIPIYGAEIPQAKVMSPGDSVVCGSLTIRACDLSGHAAPALGFHIDGLDVPVFITGDALFAGSMGGCHSQARYQQALKSLKSALAPLPDETILLPGHGPATTLAQEWMSNPFLEK